MLTDAKVIEIISEPLKTAKIWWDDYVSIYERLTNLYNGNVAENSNARLLETQYSSGEAYQIVETMLPRMIASKIRARIEPVGEEDKKGAQMSEMVLNHQIVNDGIEEKLELYVRQATKTIAIAKFDTETKEYTVKKRKHKFEMKLPIVNKTIGVGPVEEVTETKQRFRHIVENITFDDLILSPSTGWDTLPFIGFRLSLTPREMQEDGRYKNLEQVKEYVWNKVPDETKQELAKQQDVNAPNPADLFLEEKVVLNELYCRYEDKIYLITKVEDSDLIVRLEELDFWHNSFPIRVFSLIPIEGQLVGFSPLQVAEDSINALDEWVNIMHSVGLFDIMRPITYDPKKVSFDWQSNPPVYRPGAAYAAQQDGISVLSAPKVDGTHQAIYNLLKTRIQNITGITDYISGGDNVKNDTTLGEVELKTAQSNKRFELTVKRLRSEFSAIFRMMNSNNQQYLPDDYAVRMFGENGYTWKKVSLESIQGNFDYTTYGFENIATEEAQRVNKYRAMIADALKIPPGLINLPELVKMLYEDGYRVENIDRILIPIQETLGNEDQNMQAQAQDANEENQNPVTAVVRPDDDHKVHLDVHTMFLKSPAFKQLPQQQGLALARHIAAHREAMGNGQPQQPQGQAPQSSGQPMASPKFQDMVRPSQRKFTVNPEE